MNINTIKIFCKPVKKNSLSFFAEIPQGSVLLFSVGYFSRPLYSEYKNGIALSKVFDKTRKFRQQDIKDKIIKSIAVLEEDFSVTILKKTEKKLALKNHKKIRKEFTVCSNSHLTMIDDYSEYTA